MCPGTGTMKWAWRSPSTEKTMSSTFQSIRKTCRLPSQSPLHLRSSTLRRWGRPYSRRPHLVLNMTQGTSTKLVPKPACWSGRGAKTAANSTERGLSRRGSQPTRAPSRTSIPPSRVPLPPSSQGVTTQPSGRAGPVNSPATLGVRRTWPPPAAVRATYAPASAEPAAKSSAELSLTSGTGTGRHGGIAGRGVPVAVGREHPLRRAGPRRDNPTKQAVAVAALQKGRQVGRYFGREPRYTRHELELQAQQALEARINLGRPPAEDFAPIQTRLAKMDREMATRAAAEAVPPTPPLRDGERPLSVTT